MSDPAWKDPSAGTGGSARQLRLPSETPPAGAADAGIGVSSRHRLILGFMEIRPTAASLAASLVYRSSLGFQIALRLRVTCGENDPQSESLGRTRACAGEEAGHEHGFGHHQ